jgi:hypothetical protein
MKKEILVFIISFFLGIFSYKCYWRYKYSKPPKQEIKPINNYVGINDFTDETGKEIASNKLIKGRVGVFIVFGQSNTTNSESDLYASKSNVFYVYKNKFYKYSDPVLGIDGKGGTVWGLLGDKLIQQGKYDCVVFKCVGRGGTSVIEWQPGTELYERIINGNNELKLLGLTPTAVLFHQGEGDNKYRPYFYQTKDYYTDFLKINNALRKENITAPIYVSIVSLGNSPKDTAITNAQNKLIRTVKGIRRGVNTDSLVGRKYRYDETHLNYLGSQIVSDLWFKCLTTN